MLDLQEYVNHYVAKLTGAGADDAWHSIVEAGPTAPPHVIDAFNRTSARRVKVCLVQIISEYRSTAAIPFFETLLRSDEAEIWKAALDGLVTLGGEAALDALSAVSPSAAPEKQLRIDEARRQINEQAR
jgi:hypothetical protein